ncbi:MAG: OmpA family protein [Roseiarcus sp.]|jgi:outer membrane protein OmpA-like peptidoglycan-associated protein
MRTFTAFCAALAVALAAGATVATVARADDAPAPVVQRMVFKAVDAPLFDPGAACPEQAWVVTQFPGFKLAECDYHDYDSVHSDHANRDLVGRVYRTTYRLEEGVPAPAEDELKQNVVQGMKKIGAKFVFDPGMTDASRVFVRQTAAGEFWYRLDDRGGEFDLTAIEVVPVPQKVEVRADATPLKDPGSACPEQSWVVKGFPGYIPDGCDYRAYDAVYASPADTNIVGRVYTTRHTLPEGIRLPSDLEFYENFRAAFAKVGVAAVGADGNGHRWFIAKTASGEFWYYLDKGNRDYVLTTIQVVPLNQQMEFKAVDEPLADPGAGCPDPAWLVKGFPGYHNSGVCTYQPFAHSGDANVDGAIYTIMYSLPEGQRIPADFEVWRNFVDGMQKIGAKLESDATAYSSAVVSRQTARGPVWYSLGKGNADYSVSIIQPGPAPQDVAAKAVDQPAPVKPGDCQDPDWLVKSFAYVHRESCSVDDFGRFTLHLPDGDKEVTGRIGLVHYVVDDHHAPSHELVRQNFVTALEAIGAKLISKPDDSSQAILTRATPRGETRYIYNLAQNTDVQVLSYDLATVDEGGPPAAACTLEVYGINFDFDKATIRPDSEPTLKQVLALFVNNPDYSGEIGGHTDNVGKRPYNMKLSAKRAEAVKAWLVAHGVATSRMTTAGYADTVPLFPNDTDDHRFRNRRVELKRNACKG